MTLAPCLPRRTAGLALLPLLLLGACREEPAHSIVPNPRSVIVHEGDSAVIARPTRIRTDPGDPALRLVADHLEELLGYWVDLEPPPSPADTLPPPPPPADTTPPEPPSPEELADSAAVDIRLTLEGADPSLGPEGYELDVSGDGITIRGNSAAGVFHGVQTLGLIHQASGRDVSPNPRGAGRVTLRSAIDAPSGGNPAADGC